MSAVTARPQVKSVTSTALAVTATAGVVTIGAAILRALRESAEGQRLTSAIPVPAAGPKKSVEVTSLGVFDTNLATVVNGLPPSVAQASLQAEKARVLKAVAETPCLVGGSALHDAVGAVADARTAAQFRSAANYLVQTARQEHRHVMEQTVASACQAAAEEVGFSGVARAATPDGTVRMLASDAEGRALVTEIRHDVHGMLSVETEVLGIGDGACHELLDLFDAALTSHGVQSATPQRRDTGGVCQLEASQVLGRAPVARRTRPMARKSRTRVRA